jgi:hypothetical protein
VSGDGVVVRSPHGKGVFRLALRPDDETHGIRSTMHRKTDR